jgi:hypothetical protein
MWIWYGLLNLASKYSKLLIGIPIGIGLGLFLMVSLSFGSFLGMPIAFAGLVALVSGVLWFLIERKKIGFGKGASVLTLVLMPIATIPLYIFYLLTLTVFLQAPFYGLALLFIGSGFFSVGLICVYIERKPKKLGFSFMILSLLFLIGVPLVNGYQIMASRGVYGSWIATPYEGYTIPLILVTVAFFLLGCVSILYMKFLAIRKSLVDTTIIKQKRTEEVCTYEKREKLIGARKFFVSSCDAGFICLVFGSLCLIGAAVMYAPSGPTPISWNILGTASRELTLSLIIFGVALFALGFNFILYQKSERFSFLVWLLGSLVLMFAAFAHGYRIMAIADFSFFGEPVLYPVNPFREFTLPIVLVGILFVVFSCALMFRKRWFGVKI